MIEQLRELTQCGRPWAAERAMYALQITEAVHAGEIGASEYQELMRDLIRMDTLEAEADDMAIKTALVQAIYVVGQLA